MLKKHRILKKLKGNKDKVITHPDKGNGVVIMNRKDYDKAMCDILENSSKFRKLKKDPTLLKKGNYNVSLELKKSKESLMTTHMKIYIL